MATRSNKKGLNSPAVLVAASTPAGQQAIATTTETAGKAVDVLFKIIKVGFVIAAGYYVYTKYKDSFVKLGTNPNYDPANVTDGQASAKAEALYEAMAGPGANIEMVASQIAGLNYNGWVKVYNAFGNRKGANPLGKAMNLVEWIYDQFSSPDKISQLRNVLPGVF